LRIMRVRDGGPLRGRAGGAWVQAVALAKDAGGAP